MLNRRAVLGGLAGLAGAAVVGGAAVAAPTAKPNRGPKPKPTPTPTPTSTAPAGDRALIFSDDVLGVDVRTIDLVVGRTDPTQHGQYMAWNAGFPLTTGVLDTWASNNSCTIRMGHEFGDHSQWSFFNTGTNFTNWNNWVGVDTATRRFGYSCPLLTNENPQDYTGLNAGTFDSHFTSLGSAFQSRANLRNAVIRLGWEFNGNTFPWQVPSNASDAQLTSYKNGYNRAAGLIKAQCPTVKFEWCPNAHLDNANRTLVDMYPGSTYVDYVGLAVYDYYWPGGSPSQATREAWIRDDTNGLQDQLNLARSKGRPIAFTEWGLWPTANLSGGGDRPAFITFMLNWMRDNQAAYSQYNNTNATQDHRLDTYPNAKSTYINRFSTGVLTG